MKIVFFGASKYVIPIIELLHQQYYLAFVVTTEQNAHDAVPAYCTKNNISYISVFSLKNETIISQIRAIHAPVAVLAYFGLIIPQKVIDIFPKGIVNIHPSLLPKYRGTTPGQTAIMNGDTMSGVSIMLLDKDVDHGPILAQQSASILSTDTADTFYQKFFHLSAKLLGKVLLPYINQSLIPVPQDHTKATYTQMMTRETGCIDSEKPVDKELLQRMVRAYYPWPGVWTTAHVHGSKLDGKIVKFLPISTKPFPRSLPKEGGQKNEIKFGFPSKGEEHGEGFLIQVEGKKPVSVKDFLNGYPEAKEWIKKFT